MFPSGENAGFPAAAAARAPSPLGRAGAENPVRPQGSSAGADEGEAWAAVLAAWDDEARHRAYLARFDDLAGLAVAGGRYREALARRPGDPLAIRFRDEVVRRALAQGLAAAPRRGPPDARARTASRVVAVLLAVAAAVAAAALLGAGASPGAPP